MSALGQKQTFAVQNAMSAQPRKRTFAAQNKCALWARSGRPSIDISAKAESQNRLQWAYRSAFAQNIFDATIGNEPHYGDQNVDEDRNPGSDKRKGDRRNIQQRRNLAFQVGAEGCSKHGTRSLLSHDRFLKEVVRNSRHQQYDAIYGGGDRSQEIFTHPSCRNRDER